jgi:hypothetical protein
MILPSSLLSLFRQIIPLVILEEGSYEKDVLFYVNLGEPQMIGGNFNIVVLFDATRTLRRRRRLVHFTHISLSLEKERRKLNQIFIFNISFSFAHIKAEF